jgi:hypothetical protein
MFSEWMKCNDVYERAKTLRISQLSAEYEEKKFSAEVLNDFIKKVFKELEAYKQVSFCTDYDDMKGCLSPMMWGHYARDYKRSGVCIELDYQKIRPDKKEAKFYSDKVEYNSKLLEPVISGIDMDKEDAGQDFVVNNIDKLFFLKHPHWKAENEYRFISKDCESLDISDAITSVYVLEDDEVTSQAVELIVKNTKMISLLCVGGIDGQKLNPINMYDLNEIKRNINT